MFGFGHLAGETGDRRSPLGVTVADLLAVRRNLTRAGAPADTTNPYDINRDGRVNALDVATVRTNLGRALAHPAMPGA